MEFRWDCTESTHCLGDDASHSSCCDTVMMRATWGREEECRKEGKRGRREGGREGKRKTRIFWLIFWGYSTSQQRSLGYRTLMLQQLLHHIQNEGAEMSACAFCFWFSPGFQCTEWCYSCSQRPFPPRLYRNALPVWSSGLSPRRFLSLWCWPSAQPSQHCRHLHSSHSLDSGTQGLIVWFFLQWLKMHVLEVCWLE